MRIKCLPPTYATKSREVYHNILAMLQSYATVQVCSAFVSENCLPSGAQRSYAFVSAYNYENGEHFKIDT